MVEKIFFSKEKNLRCNFQHEMQSVTQNLSCFRVVPFPYWFIWAKFSEFQAQQSAFQMRKSEYLVFFPLREARFSPSSLTGAGGCHQKTTCSFSSLLHKPALYGDSQDFPSGTSLVAQWLRIRLPMQGTWVQSLVREDPTCRGATKPMLPNYWSPCALEPVRHDYWACTLEPASHNYWAHMPQLLKSARLEPVLHNKRSHCNEKPVHRNEE